MKIITVILRGLAGVLTVIILASCSSGPSVGIDSLVTGTGYDAGRDAVIGQTAQFSPGQAAYVVFTTHVPDPSAVAVITMLRNGATEDTSLPVKLAKGDHTYVQSVQLGAIPGVVTIEASYNGTVQQTAHITIG